MEELGKKSDIIGKKINEIAVRTKRDMKLKHEEHKPMSRDV